MQTFMPWDRFMESNRSLDGQRLGKQRIETIQILGSLFDGTGYRHHPVNDMWRGYERALLTYAFSTLHIWTIERRNADSTVGTLVEWMNRMENMQIPWTDFPPWVGDDLVHETHRSKLIDKRPAYYAAQFPNTELHLPYVWPKNDDDADGGYRLFISGAESKRLGTEVWLPERYRMDPKTREVLPA